MIQRLITCSWKLGLFSTSIIYFAHSNGKHDINMLSLPVFARCTSAKTGPKRLFLKYEIITIILQYNIISKGRRGAG